MRDLPWRMYQHGMAFRYHAPDGRKIPLGRDYDAALTKYHALTAPPPAYDASKPEVALQAWKRHAKGAKARGLTFMITVDDVSELLRRQHYVCAVTSLPFNDDKPQGMRIRPWLPSIDRMDGRRGYEPSNVRMVCGFVNVAMNGFGEAFFASVLKPLIDAEVAKRLSEYSHVGISMGTSDLTSEDYAKAA